MIFVASQRFDFSLFSVRLPLDYLNVPYLVHFVRFGGFFVFDVWCCLYFL